MINLKSGKHFDDAPTMTRGGFLRGILASGIAPSITMGVIANAGSANANVGRGMMRNVGARMAANFCENFPYRRVSAIDIRNANIGSREYFFNSNIDSATIGRIVLCGTYSVDVTPGSGYGSRIISTSNSSAWRIAVSNYNNGSFPGGYVVFGKTSGGNINNHYIVNEITTWDISYGHLIINGTDYGSFPSWSRPQTSDDLYFFNMDPSGCDQHKGLFYYCNIYGTNGKLISKMTPVLNEGRCAVYDEVRYILFYNEGTRGDFPYIA